MLFSNTEEILAAARSAIDATLDSPVLLAVAFWGHGADQLFRADRSYKAICNLSTGATDPRIVRRLAARYEVKHHPSLHAKVIVGANAALVGSANLSDNALGFNSRTSDHWQEAVLQVERPATDYFAIQNWFSDFWQKAEVVDEKILLLAEAAYRPVQPGVSLITAATDEQNETTLSETLLFARGPIKDGNRIRMASTILKDAFERHVEKLDTSNVRVPAFAANLLWTLSGQSVETGIQECPRFTIPDQVIFRATEPKIQPKKSIDQLWLLIQALSKDSSVPYAIRHWATIWIQRSEEDRNLGCHS
jgi:hypothetical protein